MAQAFGEQVVIVKTIRPFEILGIAPRGRLVICYKHAFAYAPVIAVRRMSARLAAFFVFRPVCFGPHRLQKIRRDRLPAALGRLHQPFRVRHHCRDHDGRMRLLIGLQHHALPHVRKHGLLSGDVPELAFDVIRRVAAPYRQYLVDRFDEHRVAVALEVTHHFHVGAQPTRPDAELKTPFEHVIHHRDQCRHLRRVVVRQIHSAAAQPDLLRRISDAGDKCETRRYGFADVRHMLADIGFAVTQFVRQQHRRAILFERLRVIAPRRVHGHCEKA